MALHGGRVSSAGGATLAVLASCVMLDRRRFAFALVFLAAAACAKPKVAGPETPVAVDVMLWSHCEVATSLAIEGGDVPRTIELTKGKETPLRLEPGESVVLERAAPVSVRKQGGTIVLGSSCRTLVSSDLGGFDDPDAGAK